MVWSQGPVHQAVTCKFRSEPSIKLVMQSAAVVVSCFPDSIGICMFSCLSFDPTPCHGICRIPAESLLRWQDLGAVCCLCPHPGGLLRLHRILCTIVGMQGCINSFTAKSMNKSINRFSAGGKFCFTLDFVSQKFGFRHRVIIMLEVQLTGCSTSC